MHPFTKRMILAGLALILALIVIPLGLMVRQSAHLRTKTHHFWRAHPILLAMRLVHDGVWTNDSRAARAVLLERVPLGTDSANAIASLSSEGFGCEKTTTAGWQVDCQLVAPALAPAELENVGWIILFWPEQRWIIDLHFDQADCLDDAKVAIWNLSL